MLQEIGQVAIFIICAQTLLHFRAKESYEKYIKLLISMMVLLLLLTPFLRGWGGKEGDTFEKMIVEYERELGEEMFVELEPEDVEKVVMSMAQEVVLQEELQEIANQQEVNRVHAAEEQEQSNNRIQVEKIQIGD